MGEFNPKTVEVCDERPRDLYRMGHLPDTVETTRTAAPKDNPHPGQYGIDIDSPYSEDFVRDLKVLPEWARTWNGEAWVIDNCFAAFAGGAVPAVLRLTATTHTTDSTYTLQPLTLWLTLSQS